MALHGSSFNAAAPPAIGSTTPAAGAFTTLSASGAAGFADGTAGAPSIAWTSDADGTGTGFYRVAANSVGVACNGGEVFRFQASQLLAIQPFGIGASGDTFLSRTGANSILFGGSSATTTSRTEINKAVTAFSNGVAKATFTVTVPNAAHNATLKFTVLGALGAGGAIGAGEAMATNTYMIGIVRTAGVATVATATAASNAVAVAVAGAATVTATAAVSAISGAVGATQTFTIDVTITRSGGSSDNHTAMCYGELLNANASGITIA